MSISPNDIQTLKQFLQDNPQFYRGTVENAVKHQTRYRKRLGLDGAIFVANNRTLVNVPLYMARITNQDKKVRVA